MTVRTIPVVGGNLFQIALRELGDATQWNRIAAINGLWDFQIQGQVMLKIPTVDPSQTGGVLGGQ